MIMATYSDYKIQKFDDFFTKKETWEQIAKYVPKNKVISMPFYSPYSKCNEWLGKYIDNKIIYQDEDFFNFDRGQIVCDNVPFSIKKEIINTLVKRDKPFMIIVPVSTICYNYCKILKNIQILIPQKRVSYLKCDENGNVNESKSSCAFDSIILCWKIHLENDITFM